MRVSMEWLRQYIDVEESAEELAEMLTSGGVEVESFEYLDKGLDRVVIGEIKEIKAHPNADKLQICIIDVGTEELNIVTGADNVRVRDRIPVAMEGAKLPGGMKIRKSKLRGEPSYGMLCSDRELKVENIGLDRSKGGILILPEDAPVGEEFRKYAGLDNWVLELELYPNRPDCLAMVNVAREVGTLCSRKTVLPVWADMKTPNWPKEEKLNIEIENEDLSFRYAGLLVDEVKIEPSPQWMQNRLRAVGVRPINNIVDITNYCMVELGQPLHAFDSDKLKGTISVRLAKEGEKLVTLDRIERKLDTDMLIIADESGPIAIAGVMGGLETEVTKDTQNIFFESAHFLGSSIRRTSRRLGLRSEASNRFEKGVNPYAAVPTLGRVAELLEELGAGKVVSFVEKVCKLPELQRIELSLENASRVLGFEITNIDARDVLDALNFKYKAKSNGEYIVDVPSYRQDIKIEVDLIEEIARIIGYDKIPTTLPEGRQTQGRRTMEQEFRKNIRQTLVSLGMNEIISYSFVKKEHDIVWGIEDKSISIINPLREELGVMRTSLVPGILEIANRNIARRNIDLLLFEIGNVFYSKEQPLKQLPDEVLKITGFAQGKTRRHWLSENISYDFFYVKGILTELAKQCGVEFEYRLVEDEKMLKLLHPGRSAEVLVNGEKMGFLGEMHPKVNEVWGMVRPILFELDFAILFNNSTALLKAKSYPKYPAIQRDLAVVVPDDISAVAISNRIFELGGDLLKEVEVFDVYKGLPVPPDRKSLAFTMRYQSNERTLTDEEVNSLNSRILDGIQQDFGAEWRK
ncbi:MAG: phenylalanine--tRNA ligase subunit beta [Eubacteriales bacterium]